VTRNRGTKTYKFGAGRREAHDSSPFYSRKVYRDVELPEPSPRDLVENPVPPEFLDKIILGDARDVLKKLPDSCVHLVVTSPPYNTGKEYDEDLTLGEYLDFIEEVMREVHRVLVWGGRVCFNVADLGRKPYIPLHAYLIERFERVGFLMRGVVIWYKGDAVAGGSTAWGTFASPVNPVLRDVHEYIVVMSKGGFKRSEPPGREATISKEEFVEFTRSVWKFSPESAKRVGHPAPFPLDLPYRCIQLYTFKGDVVLDPFIGSGTTAVVATLTGRHFIGIDINPEDVRATQRRVEEVLKQRELTDFVGKLPKN